MLQKTLQICMCLKESALWQEAWGMRHVARVAVAFYEIINMYVLNGLKSEWHIKFLVGPTESIFSAFNSMRRFEK